MNNSISVKLPHECSGQEILDAFRAASTFQETETVKWEAHGYKEPGGIATAKNPFSPKIGYYATPAYLRKKGGTISRFLFGRREPVWETDSGMDVSRYWSQIKLHAVCQTEVYTELEITVTHLTDAGDVMCEYVRVIHDPDDDAFASHRPAYDRIIRTFLERLQ